MASMAATGFQNPTTHAAKAAMAAKEAMAATM